jgi:hypothetical protein
MGDDFKVEVSSEKTLKIVLNIEMGLQISS